MQETLLGAVQATGIMGREQIRAVKRSNLGIRTLGSFASLGLCILKEVT